MDIIFKIIAVGLIACIASMIIKPVRSDFSIIIGVVAGIIIVCMIISYLTGIFQTFDNIVQLTGLSSSLYKLLLKIIGIGYLIEFSANICSDTGNSSIGDKIILGGKIVIMIMSLPIVTSIVEIIMELLPQ